MNNKGFAITSILYTIFVLFLLILISILFALNNQNNLMRKSIESLEDDYVKLTELKDNESGATAQCTGKYIFFDNTAIYLKKGATIPEYKNLFGTYCFKEN